MTMADNDGVLTYDEYLCACDES